ncbi:MAG: hypothetical protein ABEJ96_08345, partial [Thiohalorhabdaceae bacterium]
MKRNDMDPLSLPGGAERGSDQGALPEQGGQRVLAPERWLVRKLLDTVGSPPIAVTLWDGRPLEPEPADPVARVHLRDRGAFYRLLRHPDLHFGDDFAAGRIEVEGDLVAFLTTVDRYRQARNGYGGGRPG